MAYNPSSWYDPEKREQLKNTLNLYRQPVDKQELPGIAPPAAMPAPASPISPEAINASEGLGNINTPLATPTSPVITPDSISSIEQDQPGQALLKAKAEQDKAINAFYDKSNPSNTALLATNKAKELYDATKAEQPKAQPVTARPFMSEQEIAGEAGKFTKKEEYSKFIDDAYQEGKAPKEIKDKLEKKWDDLKIDIDPALENEANKIKEGSYEKLLGNKLGYYQDELNKIDLDYRQKMQQQQADLAAKVKQESADIEKWSQLHSAAVMANDTGKSQTWYGEEYKPGNRETLRATANSNEFTTPDGRTVYYDPAKKAYFKEKPQTFGPGMTTGKRIGYAIAGALIAMGSTLAGRDPSAGMNAIQSFLGAEMEKQKEKYDNMKGIMNSKSNLIALAKKNFQDQQTAEAAAQNLLLSSTERELNRIISTTKNSTTKDNAMLLKSFLNEQKSRAAAGLEIDKFEAETKRLAVVNDKEYRDKALSVEEAKYLTEQQLERLKAEARVQEKEQQRADDRKAIEVDEFTIANPDKMVPTPKQADELRRKQGAVSTITYLASQLKPLAGTTLNPTSANYARAESLASQLVVALKEASNLGVIAGPDAGIINQMSPMKPNELVSFIKNNSAMLDETIKGSVVSLYNQAGAYGYKANEDVITSSHPFFTGYSAYREERSKKSGKQSTSSTKTSSSASPVSTQTTTGATQDNVTQSKSGAKIMRY